MKDLRNPRLMWLKAVLFLIIGAVCAALLWFESPTFKTGLLLLLGIWAFVVMSFAAFFYCGFLLWAKCH